METLKEIKRRYKLHQRIKKRYKYNAFKRTIYVPFNEDYEKDIALMELFNKFKYTLAFIII